MVIADRSDTWGHNVLRFDGAVGAFAPTRVRLVEHGPVRATIRVESAWGTSALIQDFTLYRELDGIEVRATVDWHERHAALKLRFPANIEFVAATYEIPYGHIERETDGEEEPGQSWLDISGVARETGQPYGLSILNDGKYSFDVLGKDLGLTVLRSPIYAHHGPRVPEPDGLFSYLDQGIQRFTYTILPHEGGWREAGTVRRAAELNARPIALLETYHDGEGRLPQRGSFAAVDAENIVIGALKRAEDGEAIIVRCHETAGRSCAAAIDLPLWGRRIEARFRPCEIKTFRVPLDGESPVAETNLLEWTAAESDSP